MIVRLRLPKLNWLIAVAFAGLLGIAFITTGVRAQEMGGDGAPSAGTIPMPAIPRITIQAIPSYGPSPLTVGFLVSNANPGSAPLVNFRWNFGDGQVSTLPPEMIFHVYPNPGSYVVTVTGTTADGLSATGFAGVTVRPGGTY